MAQYQTILVDKNERITTVTFNRPEQRNTMSPQLHRDMYAALNELRHNQETRVIILTGAGSSFCPARISSNIFSR
jgi:enoyl-CoA hydratase/carnithine racemase